MFVPLQTFARAVQLVQDLGELTDSADFVPMALPAITDLLGCDVITYNEVGTMPSAVMYEEWPPRSLDPHTQEMFSRFVHEHPSIEHYRTTSDSRPVMISDFLGAADFHRLGLYAEFFRHIPVEHQLSLSLNDTPSTVIGIALNRSRGEFDDVDREVLAVLRRPLLLALMRVRLRQSSAVPVDLLSPRETAVLRLVAQGKTNIAIGRTLGISPRTVAKHLERSYRKLNVTSRAAAAARQVRIPQKTPSIP